jgi:hypothetical protein
LIERLEKIGAAETEKGLPGFTVNPVATGILPNATPSSVSALKPTFGVLKKH